MILQKQTNRMCCNGGRRVEVVAYIYVKISVLSFCYKQSSLLKYNEVIRYVTLCINVHIKIRIVQKSYLWYTIVPWRMLFVPLKAYKAVTGCFENHKTIIITLAYLICIITLWIGSLYAFTKSWTKTLVLVPRIKRCTNFYYGSV